MTDNDPWASNQWVDYFNSLANPEIGSSKDDDDDNTNGGGGGGGGDNPGGDPGGSGPGGPGSGSGGGGRDDDDPDKDGPDNDGPDDGNGPGNNPPPPPPSLRAGPTPSADVQLSTEEEVRLQAARDSFYSDYLDQYQGERSEEVSGREDTSSDGELSHGSEGGREEDLAVEHAGPDLGQAPGHDLGRDD